MMRRADAIVIGAGPAGSSAALALARGGREVVLLDRERFPRAKVCGDGLTPRAIAALEELGLWASLARSAAMVRALRTVDLGSGQVRSGPLPSRVGGGPEVGAVLSRTVLDDALRRAAVASGVRSFEARSVQAVQWGRGGRPVRLLTRAGEREETFEAPVVVAADGANSRIARLAFGAPPGVVRGVAVRQYWRVAAAPAFTICVPLTGTDAVAGYGWIFPTEDGGANVGVGRVGSGPDVVRRLYDAFIRRLREIDPAWRFADPCGPLEGGALGAGLQRQRIARGPVLFVGDAAGSVNPFSGEGIAQAIEGGQAAAEAVLAEPGDAAAVAEAYWAGLVRRFPHTTRNVESLPWVVARGKTFAREFWHAASGDDRLVGRAARRMTLDEDATPGGDATAGSARAAAAFAAAERRLARRRPLLAQFLEACRTEAAPDVAAALAALYDDAPAGAPAGADVAVALLAMIVLVGRDPAGGAPVRRLDDAAAIGAWAADSVALATADVLVAELMGVLAALPAGWAVRLAEAASELMARESRAVLGARESRAVLGRRPVPSLAERLGRLRRFAQPRPAVAAGGSV